MFADRVWVKLLFPPIKIIKKENSFYNKKIYYLAAL